MAHQASTRAGIAPRLFALGRFLARRAPLLAFTLAAALTLLHLRAMLTLSELPMRGDPSLGFGSDLTPSHYPWLLSAMRSLFDTGTLPFWNSYINGGTPQFEAPEAGVLSLAVLLGGALPPEGAIQASLLLHILAGMAGVYLFARKLKAAPLAAALGALAFGLSPYLTSHLRSGHLGFLLPMALMPWSFLCLWNALTAPRRGALWAVASGLFAGLGSLEGGTTPVLYGAIGMALCAVCVVLGPDRRAFSLRLITSGAVAALAALAVAAPQALPMMSFMRLTGRAEGLAFKYSQAAISEVANAMPSLTWFFLAALGLLFALRKGAPRAGLWLALCAAFGVAIWKLTPLYWLLWRFVPGFAYQRIPERALVLTYTLGPILVALGLTALWDSERRPRIMRGAALLLGALLLFQIVDRAAPLLPTAPPRREQRENPAMQWLAEHARGARVHIWESRDRHWGCDHVTLPLGLEAITSYTATEHHDYLPSDFDPPGYRTFVGESYRAPAKFWGLLDVKYVLSSTPRDTPGFRLAARVEPCPVERCQPKKSAGTYIYENEMRQGRAWHAERALVLVGPERATFEAALDLMQLPEFAPGRTVILQTAPESALARESAGARIAAGLDLPGLPRWPSKEARALARATLAPAARVEPTPTTPSAAVEVARLDANRLSVSSERAGWLVLSEKLALYPGWSARDGSGVTLTIHRADGVLAAVKTDAAGPITLSYRPPRWPQGLALSLLLAAALSLWLVARHKRDNPAPLN